MRHIGLSRLPLVVGYTCLSRLPLFVVCISGSVDRMISYLRYLRYLRYKYKRFNYTYLFYVGLFI